MSNERIYQPLTKKDRERLEELKKLQASGHMMPKLHESLIGIPEDEFQIDWPGKDAKQTRMYSLPPELTSYAFNGIDAYAMALLATETFLAPNCRMTAKCAFEKRDDEQITLRFSSTTDRLTPELFGQRIAKFLIGFRAALVVKEIKPESPIFCGKVGAQAWFVSPGELVVSKSILAEIPEAEWPVASRSFEVTDELRAAARNALLLLTTPESQMNTDQV